MTVLFSFKKWGTSSLKYSIRETFKINETISKLKKSLRRKFWKPLIELIKKAQRLSEKQGHDLDTAKNG